MGCVSNKAFNGDKTLNSFNFHYHHINHLSLYVDGQQIPSKPLQPEFDGNATWIHSYHTLFSGTWVHFQNEAMDISRESYAKGYCLFAFDLTPDLSANCYTHWNLVRHGSVRIEVRFAQSLTSTINCILYAEYDNVFEIDSARQVITDFSA